MSSGTEPNGDGDDPAPDTDEETIATATFRGFALVEVVEIIHLVLFIVGGAFTAAAGLMQLIGVTPEVVVVQASIGGIGGFLLGVVVLIEFILQRYG